MHNHSSIMHISRAFLGATLRPPQIFLWLGLLSVRVECNETRTSGGAGCSNSRGVTPLVLHMDHHNRKISCGASSASRACMNMHCILIHRENASSALLLWLLTNE
jgi:hypothetical protein